MARRAQRVIPYPAAEIKLLLIKQGDAWMIEGFHINSSALMRQLVGMRS